MIYTVGIDPGKTGAAALLGDGELVQLIDWSDGPTVARQIHWWQDLYAPKLWVLEKVFYMPRKDGRAAGGKSVWTFASHTAWWVGALDVLGVPWRDVPPQTWMKGLVGKKSSPTDKPGLPVARRLYPRAELHLKKHHNRADALLIARWAYIAGVLGKV